MRVLAGVLFFLFLCVVFLGLERATQGDPRPRACVGRWAESFGAEWTPHGCMVNTPSGPVLEDYIRVDPNRGLRILTNVPL